MRFAWYGRSTASERKRRPAPDKTVRPLTCLRIRLPHYAGSPRKNGSAGSLKIPAFALLLSLAAMLALPAAALAQSCRIDSQIPDTERAAIEAAGLSFVNAVLAGKADQAYADFTADTQAHLPADGFAQMMAGA